MCACLLILLHCDKENTEIKMGIFGDAKPTTIAGFILAIVSFVLQLTSFATPYWMHIKMGTVDSHFGLWQMCLPTTSGTTECAQIECGM